MKTVLLRCFYVLPAILILVAGVFGQTSSRDGMTAGKKDVSRDPPIIVKAIVLCYNPSVPAEGNRKLWQVFNWNDPKILVELCRTEINKYSHGRVAVEFVDWVDINGIPQRVDGNTYSPNRYTHNRRTNSGWVEKDQEMDYYKVMRDHHVAERINAGEIDEVWVIGDHYFSFWEAAMMGPGAFFINGGIYPNIDTDFPFAVMGGSYERNVDCMLENILHRTENHMSRAYGGWNLGNPKTNWDRFTANIEQSPITPGVGTCHYSPNSKSDYDWGNERFVDSTAEDWLNYPDLTGKTTRINCEAWRKTGWHQWWMGHLPKAPGVHPDGRQNNWWKYVYDFDNYEPKTGAPKPIRAFCNPNRLRFDPKRKRLLLRVAYSSPNFIEAASLEKAKLRAEWNGTPAELVFLKASDKRNDTRLVADYAIPLPKDREFTGTMSVHLEDGQIRDLAGGFVPAVKLADFDLEIDQGKPYQNGPLDLNEMIQRKELRVDHYESDIGSLRELLNPGTDGLLRSRNVNPAEVRFEFARPVTLTGIRFKATNNNAGRFRVEIADSARDLSARTGSYSEPVPWKDTSPLKMTGGDLQSENTVAFEKPVRAKTLRFTFERSGGDDYVHIAGLRLYSRRIVTDGK